MDEFASLRARAARPARGPLLMLAVPLLLFACAEARAQRQAAVPFSGALLPPATTSKPVPRDTVQVEEEEFIKPSRPGVALPAEAHEPGVLQIEFGYDGNFRAEVSRAEHALALTLRFAAHKRLLLQADLDTFKAETDAQTRERRTGVGDARLGLQFVALEDTEEHPALAFAYFVKIPSASEEKGLGTGRFDHKLVGLLSKKFGETDVDFNFAYLLVGAEGGGGWEHGGQAALAVAREFENKLGFAAEVAGQSRDDIQPRGVFALGALTYKASRGLAFDAGLRFGLNPEAPRVGFFAGATLGVGGFKK